MSTYEPADFRSLEITDMEMELSWMVEYTFPNILEGFWIGAPKEGDCRQRAGYLGKPGDLGLDYRRDLYL